jgi:hypothetical protein
MYDFEFQRKSNKKEKEGERIRNDNFIPETSHKLPTVPKDPTSVPHVSGTTREVCEQTLSIASKAVLTPLHKAFPET